MTEPRRPNFMKMEVSKEAQRPAPPPPAAAGEGEKKAPVAPAPAAPVAPAAPAGGAPPARPSRMNAAATVKLDVGELTMVLGPEGGAAGKAPISLYDRAEIAAGAIRSELGGDAKIAVVLGSGLGAFGDALEGLKSMSYERVPGFPSATVAGHRGRLAFGRTGGVPVFAMQGRFHYYEGYSLEDVTFPIRTLGRLGVKLVILTNAAGGISEDLRPGDIMAITDHLNLIGASPLRGANDERFGPRFPDLSEVYGATWRDALFAAKPEGIPLKRGVYAAMPGPSYETPAEIRMLAKLGADAVGMSTVPEAIVAAHMGMGVVGLSGIANRAAGTVAGQRLTHAEVIDQMKKNARAFQTLLEAAIPALAKALG